VTIAVLPDAALERLVALAERERSLLEELDLAGLEALHAEREPLLAQLASHRPAPGSGPVLERLRAQLQANEALATRQRADIRAKMSHIGSGRRAINAYAPGGGGDTARTMAWLDREG
jgi:hypothetical protein